MRRELLLIHPLDLRRDKTLDLSAVDRTALTPTELCEMELDEIPWSLVILIGY